MKTTFFYNGRKDALEDRVANPFRYGPHSNREYGDYIEGYYSVKNSSEMEKLNSREEKDFGE